MIRAHATLGEVHEMLLPFLDIGDVWHPRLPARFVNFYGAHRFCLNNNNVLDSDRWTQAAGFLILLTFESASASSHARAERRVGGIENGLFSPVVEIGGRETWYL